MLQERTEMGYVRVTGENRNGVCKGYRGEQKWCIKGYRGELKWGK
jgi:hypothetical protein